MATPVEIESRTYWAMSWLILASALRSPTPHREPEAASELVLGAVAIGASARGGGRWTKADSAATFDDLVSAGSLAGCNECFTIEHDKHLTFTAEGSRPWPRRSPRSPYAR